MKETVTKKANEISKSVISHRRFLHENAESGFDTDITSQYIYNTLCQIGIECSLFEKNIVIGKIYGKPGGKNMLLRADIDALDITEETNLDYACKCGKMHACGHDMHAAMLLGAAKILSQLKENFYGCITLLFQPAEEILSGAKKVIEEGLIENTDYAMTVHVMTAENIPTGSVLLSYDTPSAPSADFLTIKIKGIGCHGSSPSIGIDPISCACRIITDISHIKTHEIGIHDKAVLTFGEIHGGKNANAIPDEVKMRGTLRCFDESVRNFYKKRFEEISKGIASAFRCGCEIEYTSGCPSLINNSELLEKTTHNLSEILGKDNVIKIKDTRSKTQGSEDFAYISQAIPSVSVAIAAGEAKKGFKFPLHNPKVIFDEKALSVGCKVFAYNAIKVLNK